MTGYTAGSGRTIYNNARRKFLEGTANIAAPEKKGDGSRKRKATESPTPEKTPSHAKSPFRAKTPARAKTPGHAKAPTSAKAPAPAKSATSSDSSDNSTEVTVKDEGTD